MLVSVLWLGTLTALAWCTTVWLTGADPAGLFMAAVTTLGLGGWALFGTRARPRLRADPDGVTVRGFGAARHVPWPFVQDVRVVRVRRLGITSAQLEIDTARADGSEQLLVFGRFDLGVDPEEAVTALRAARP